MAPNTPIKIRITRRANPQLYVPNFFLGKRLFQTNRYSEAKAFFQAALAINAKDLETRRWLAVTYVGLEEFDKGIDEYRKLSKIDPQNADALYAIGKIYTELMERSLRQITSTTGSLYRNLILVEAVEIGPEWRMLAKSELPRLIKDNPAFPGLSLELGDLQLEERNVDEAARYFQDEIAIDPLSFRAHYGLSQASLVLGKYEDFEHFRAPRAEREVGIVPPSGRSKTGLIGCPE